MNKIKKIIAGACCSLCLFAAVGCNQTVFDTEYTFEKDIVCIGGE